MNDITALMSKFTKEQLIEWADKLIEETHSDISISRTDAHAESYRAQLALFEIALASLTASMEQEPVAEVYQPANIGICAALGPSVRMLAPLAVGTKLYAAPQLPRR